MVEEYWLYKAYNECLEECLAEFIEPDISDGFYTPTTSDDDSDYHCSTDNEDADECDEEDLEDYDEEDYDLDAYYEWVKKHDHEFVADRVGVDLDACRNDEVNYKIYL